MLDASLHNLSGGSVDQKAQLATRCEINLTNWSRERACFYSEKNQSIMMFVCWRSAALGSVIEVSKAEYDNTYMVESVFDHRESTLSMVTAIQSPFLRIRGV